MKKSIQMLLKLKLTLSVILLSSVSLQARRGSYSSFSHSSSGKNSYYRFITKKDPVEKVHVNGEPEAAITVHPTSFHAIQGMFLGTLEVYPADQLEVKLIAKKPVLDATHVTSDKGELKILMHGEFECDRGVKPKLRCLVGIPSGSEKSGKEDIKSLDSITLSGEVAASVAAKYTEAMKCNKLEIALNGRSSLNILGKGNYSIDASLSGSTSLSAAQVTCDRVHIKGGGRSQLEFQNLQVNNKLSCKISGGSHMEVKRLAAQKLDLAGSGASIFSIDTCQVDLSSVHLSGGSKLNMGMLKAREVGLSGSGGSRFTFEQVAIDLLKGGCSGGSRVEIKKGKIGILRFSDQRRHALELGNVQVGS